jgi:hypothetical protein
MALIASKVGVFFAKWKAGRIVFGKPVFGWLEPIHAVAGLACALVGPLGKLSEVRIRLVAVLACAERDWFPEVAATVATFAIHLQVLACQRILRLRVVEAGFHRCLPPL